jgi:hypothetical protein
MFNRSAIMKDAWARYHQIRKSYGAWQIERGIVDGSFSACLKAAWRAAKASMAKAAEEAKLEAALKDPQGAALSGLLNALEQTNYLSFRYRASQQRASIQSQISRLVSVAA